MTSNISSEYMDSIESNIRHIIQLPEIQDLLNFEDSSVNIARPLFECSNNTMIDKDNNMGSNFILKASNRHFENRFHELLAKDKLQLVTSHNNRVDIMNGIRRVTDLRTDKERCYEEIIFHIVDTINDTIWMITINNRCPSNLIPMIIDYDNSHKYSENIYNTGSDSGSLLRETVIDDNKGYEIFQTFTPDMFENAEILTNIISALERDYQSLC